MVKSKKSLPLAIKSALIGLCAINASALAQDAIETKEDAVTEEITVIGTSIKGLDLENAVQAIQIDRQAITESGASSVADLLADLPQTAGGAGTFTASTGGPLSGSTPTGAGAVSLRGLGTSSTLTLINGRRASVSSFANGQESFVDINAIPSSAIERVEVLPSGASALYGADAVAGVVNVVLRDDFDGLEVKASYGDSTASTDEGKTTLSAVWGKTAADHSILAMVDVYQRNDFHDRDRAISRDSIRPSQQGIYPSFNDFYWNYDDVTEAPSIGGCPEDQYMFGRYGEYCEFDGNDYASVWGDHNATSGMVNYRFNLNDTTTFFIEAIGSQYTSESDASPANFSKVPFDPENPYFTQDFQDQMIAASVADGGDEAWYWDDYFGYSIYAWGKFNQPRSVEVEAKSYRFVSGVEGKLGDYDYEVAATYGGSKSTQTGSGLYITQAFYDAALGNLCSDGTRIDRWDTDLVARRADYNGGSCEDIGKTTLWYNPLGGQTMQDPGIAEFVETSADRSGESDVFAIDGVISGEIFELDAGSVYGALGFEYRKESVLDVPAGVAVATSDNPEPVFGFSSTTADAERSSSAVFGEVYAPITETLELQLAARYDNYDDFGSDVNPKVGLLFAPSDLISVRANWSTSFRAPALAQVGAGTLLSSYTVDCYETPEACDGLADEDGESLLSEDVSNPDLMPETATTWGAGVIVKPNADMDFKIDYWNIEHENLIGIDEDDFIRRALDGEFPIYDEGLLPTGVAGLEVRNGFVTDAHFQLTNLGYQKTSGVDFSFTQYFNVMGGELALLADATYLLEFERMASESSGIEKLAGDYRYPELLANTKLRYSKGAISASFGLNYTSSYLDDPSNRTLEAVGLDSDAVVEVDSWTVANLNLSYDISKNVWLNLNVRNLFDKEAPLVLGTGANVDHYNHESVGRFMTLSISAKI